MKNKLDLSSYSHDEMTDRERCRIEGIVSTLDTVACSGYQKFYVIDYRQNKFLYVSENPFFLDAATCTNEEMKQKGHLFYEEYISNEERDRLKAINHSAFELYQTFPVEERTTHTLSYNFPIQIKRKKYLIHHKWTPLLLTKDGEFWLTVCVVSLAPKHSSHNSIITQKGSTYLWNYNEAIQRWEQALIPVLNLKMKKVLLLASAGYTLEEIANELCVSMDSVKSHRKSLFKKFQTRNIGETVVMAMNLGML
jgi:DNA-binding CsgD family transcriptional regulator